ncbi:hypothetical protein VIGAN_02327000 [Vigna angularis var. angularis]|uniref:Integrase zinc-binding domain-containing protein n=1 Tax=Vigna angularis var. angularis TaxID=157739 RepID=A0A0S3RIC3_PHAAN|nr:hypothetical protein VIGAN_02327000 [Vigna angularis var. angularis]
MSAVMEDLLVNPTAHSLYELQKGRLYYHDKLVLPKHYSRIPTIIQELHESPLGGHSGYFRILKRIAGALHWEAARKGHNRKEQRKSTSKGAKGNTAILNNALIENVVFVASDSPNKR